eukprot:5625519-Pleurochrysis_carterae.AAC.2
MQEGNSPTTSCATTFCEVVVHGSRVRLSRASSFIVGVQRPHDVGHALSMKSGFFCGGTEKEQVAR